MNVTRSTAPGTDTGTEPRPSPPNTAHPRTHHRSRPPRDGRRRARICDDAAHRARARRRGDVALRARRQPRDGQGRHPRRDLRTGDGRVRVPRARSRLGGDVSPRRALVAPAPQGAPGRHAAVRRGARARAVGRVDAPDGVRAPAVPGDRAVRPRHGAGVPRVRGVHPGVRDHGAGLDRGRHQRRDISIVTRRSRPSCPTSSRRSARSILTGPSATPTTSSTSAWTC